MAVSAPQITTEHVRRFRDEGFFVLKSVLPHTELELLRTECQRFIDERDREMDRLGVDKLDLDHRGSRYFVHAYGKSPGIERFLRSDFMVEIARAALGDTVYLLPYSRAGTRNVVEHIRDEETNDLVGYFGDDPGDPVIVPAGSIACFSSTLFHRSGPNTTDHMRRVYLAQYTAEPLLNKDGSQPRLLAEPLLVDGKRL